MRACVERFKVCVRACVQIGVCMYMYMCTCVYVRAYTQVHVCVA